MLQANYSSLLSSSFCCSASARLLLRICSTFPKTRTLRPKSVDMLPIQNAMLCYSNHPIITLWSLRLNAPYLYKEKAWLQCINKNSAGKKERVQRMSKETKDNKADRQGETITIYLIYIGEGDGETMGLQVKTEMVGREHLMSTHQ